MNRSKATGAKDDLTGLYTYKEFMRIFDEELEKAEESCQELSIALVDMDFFKRINDEKGHLAGDEILKILANLLSDFVSDNGTVFRYGGEEFAIIFPNTEKEKVFLIMEQVRSSFDKEHEIEIKNEKMNLKLTFSGGISSYPEDGTKINDIIRKADGALYRSKESGRNKICLSREEKMVTKTSHYSQDQLKRLAQLSKKEGIGEAVFLREALDDLLKKYADRRFPDATGR